MAMLKLACLFPAAAWGLQAFTVSDRSSKDCELSRHTERSNCTKLVTPGLLFIGQAYSGSTSLFNLMDLHPELHGNIKEHHYFDAIAKAKAHSHHSDTANTLSEYKKQFCVPCSTKIGIDATMDYINLGYAEHGGRKALEKIKSTVGANVKIMMMLRNPVDLLFSGQCQGRPNPKKPFTADSPPNITTHEVSVTEPLSVWQEVFPNKKNWLFLKSEDFFADQRKAVNMVFKFLGVHTYDVVTASEEAEAETKSLREAGRRRCTISANNAERKAYASVQANIDDQDKLEKMTEKWLGWN